MQVFTGNYQQSARFKQDALDKRFILNPERFVRGRPVEKMRPTEVAIKPISAEDIADGVVDRVNFPTMHAAGYQANAIYQQRSCLHPASTVLAHSSAPPAHQTDYFVVKAGNFDVKQL